MQWTTLYVDMSCIGDCPAWSFSSLREKSFMVLILIPVDIALAVIMSTDCDAVKRAEKHVWQLRSLTPGSCTWCSGEGVQHTQVDSEQ